MNQSDFFVEQKKIIDIRLDQNNPRIGKKSDQNACIISIIESINFINLVDHIAENGLGLAPVVTYKNPSDGKYVVMDGNRRLTALKLLTNPTLANGNSLHSRIVKASDIARTNGNLPLNNEITVHVSTNLQPIYEHMSLTHTGELNGVGQKDWTAMGQALFAIAQNIDDDNLMAACLVIFANNEFSFSFNEEYPVTILTRLINRDRLKELNLKYENRQVIWEQKDSVAEKVLSRILTDIRDGHIVTNDVYTQEQQRSYLDNLYSAYNYLTSNTSSNSKSGTGSGNNAGQTAGNSTGSGNNSGTGTGSNSSAGTGSNSSAGTGSNSSAGTGSNSGAGTGSNSGAASGNSRATSPRKPSWDRNHVIDKRKHIFDFSSHPRKLSDLYIELSKLDLDGKKGTPLSVAFAIRAFIEISVDHYRKKHSTGGKSLADKSKNAASHLLTANKINSDINLLIQRCCSDTDSFISIGSLQKYLHSSTSFHPNKQNLNTLWDDFYPFIVECLKA